MYILELSKEHPELPVWEVKSLLEENNIKKISSDKKYLTTENIEIKLVKRLAYTKAGYKILFSCNEDKILDTIAKYDLNNLIKSSYKIYHIDIKKSQREKINNKVWNTLKEPKVSMRNPKYNLFFIKINQKIYCTLRIWINKEKWQERLPHKRGPSKPISLYPKLARCIVNLTGCKKGKITDPMTGTSGILLEATLCGLKAKGFDIDQEMLEISKNMFTKYKINKNMYQLKKKNFFKQNKKIEFIATDLPYGKNTKNIDSDFYEKFLSKLSEILINKAVIIFPDNIKIRNICKRNNLQLIKEFCYYIHGSMSKHICIIEKY